MAGKRIRIATLLAFAAATLSGAPYVYAEQPIATELDSAEASEFLGVWVMDLEFRNRPVQLILHVVDISGKMAATLDSIRQSEPKAIYNIEKTEEGLRFDYKMKFGTRAFPLQLKLKIEEGKVVGTMGDDGGVFSTPVEGIRHLGDPSTILESGVRPPPTETRIKIGDNKVRVTFVDVKADEADYAALSEMKEGEVIRFTEARATKIFTDTDLQFGDTLIKSGNAHESYPGVYSLWLKKTSDGWHLVFNAQADIWGTRHRAEADVAEIPIAWTETEEGTDTFVVKLEEEDNGGLIKLAWGTNAWSAPFKLVQ